jgi:ATP-dependent DNA helicase HFM1/MER3
MTSEQQKDVYSDLMKGQIPIESSLLKQMIEHLNAEIVVNKMHDQASALEWVNKQT